jgi:hypothetical protein
MRGNAGVFHSAYQGWCARHAERSVDGGKALERIRRVAAHAAGSGGAAPGLRAFMVMQWMFRPLKPARLQRLRGRLEHLPPTSLSDGERAAREAAGRRLWRALLGD